MSECVKCGARTESVSAYEQFAGVGMGGGAGAARRYCFGAEDKNCELIILPNKADAAPPVQRRPGSGRLRPTVSAWRLRRQLTCTGRCARPVPSSLFGALAI